MTFSLNQQNVLVIAVAVFLLLHGYLLTALMVAVVLSKVDHAAT